MVTAPEATAERASPSPRRPSSFPRIGGWIGVGLGVIAFGVGGLQESELRSAGHDFQGARTQRDQFAARDRGEDAAELRNAAFVTGGVLATAGATMLVLDYAGVFGESAPPSASSP